MSENRRHVLFIPFMALGHINPMVHLARRFSQSHDVTVVISEARVQEAKDHHILTPDDAEQMAITGLIDGITSENDKDVTPKGFMDTENRVWHLTEELYQNLPTRTAPLQEEISVLTEPITRPVDCIIVDLFAYPHWKILAEKKLPYILFNTSAGFVTYNKMNLDENTPELPDDVFFTDWESSPDLSLVGMPVHGKNMLRIPDVEKHCAGNVFSSLKELEEETVPVMATHPSTTGKPAWFIAPVLSAPPEEKLSQENLEVQKWLEKQEPGSVVYVSFGSMAIPKEQQVKEIAKALVALGKPFIWSLKPTEQDLLPKNVLQGSRAGNAGEIPRHLILSWAPQRTILANPAIAVFVSHAGWNSTLESIYAGVPMVCWPNFGDQFGDASLVARLGIGLKLPDTGMPANRIIPAHELVDTTETVAGWKSGGFETGSFVRKAKEFSKMAHAALSPGGSSESAYQDLVKLSLLESNSGSSVLVSQLL